MWLGTLLAVLAFRPLVQALRVVPMARLRHDLRFRLIAVVDGTIQLAATGTSVGMAAAGAGPAAIVVPQVLREVAATILYLRVAPPVLPKRVHRGHSRALLWTYITAASAEYVHGLVMNIPLLAVVYLAGDHEAGLFGFAFMLAIQANGIIPCPPRGNPPAGSGATSTPTNAASRRVPSIHASPGRGVRPDVSPTGNSCGTSISPPARAEVGTSDRRVSGIEPRPGILLCSCTEHGLPQSAAAL